MFRKYELNIIVEDGRLLKAGEVYTLKDEYGGVGGKMEIFARRLVKARKDKHLSPEKLAKKIGLSGTAIRNYERGSATPNLQNAATIAKELDVSIDWLCGGDAWTIDYLLSDDSRMWAIINEYKEDRKSFKKMRDAIPEAAYLVDMAEEFAHDKFRKDMEELLK
jgi:transcriptional regulator with XRE-family HTH domain